MNKIVKDNIIHLIYMLLSPLSDRTFSIIQHRIVNGRRLNLDNPESYNDKIHWIKVYDHNPVYHKLADKIEVRKWVSERIGEKYLIPIVGGPWNNCEEIDYDKLPDKFVLKCTHDSGGILICHDKKTFDIHYANRFLTNRMNHDYYLHGREWAYKGLVPKVYAEKYMVDESGVELKDYKVFCFDGVPKVIQVDFGRYTKHERNLYTTDWRYIPVQIKYPTNPDHQIDKPKCLEEMLDIATKLSAGLIQARIDLYVIYDKVYFGEITLYHGSGCEKFKPIEFGHEMGSYINLNQGK
ncbi:ATP-grasp fold amidoligase family protein [Butyrivibrio hungatei]|uniref:TupA-like ATPgrasp polysaccharide biosynthesis protein n=1 Tax=Butyrivibrio hungatei TaxID=185008 RepID=A0A1D9NYP5_9FIRM|nr:ATP-grasp fold amidoligase family protein [Butyrivibrio hungatei]AOZ95496.1 TupA-like ATPgrasp polysaccharide biosynthesis protein [Butyrivibrio hungatei]